MKQKRQIDIAATLETREADDGKRTIIGLIPYNVRSVDMGFVEVITPTAFERTLQDRADVKAMFAHDDTKILGRVKNGTLRLASTEAGLSCECDLPDTSYARDVYELIKRGDVTTMSFGFYPIPGRTESISEGGMRVDYLREVKLTEVSFAVVFPAYDATTSEVREVHGINIDAIAEILGKNELSTEDRSTLANVSKTIMALIEPRGIPDSAPAESSAPADFLTSLLAASNKEL